MLGSLPEMSHPTYPRAGCWKSAHTPPTLELQPAVEYFSPSRGGLRQKSHPTYPGATLEQPHTPPTLERAPKSQLFFFTKSEQPQATHSHPAYPGATLELPTLERHQQPHISTSTRPRTSFLLLPWALLDRPNTLVTSI